MQLYLTCTLTGQFYCNLFLFCQISLLMYCFHYVFKLLRNMLFVRINHLFYHLFSFSDYRLPPMTARGYHPIPGQINGFVNSINLPLKPLYLNPFPNALDKLDARFQEPILITLKSTQKYFIPSQSVVQQEAVAAAL